MGHFWFPDGDRGRPVSGSGGAFRREAGVALPEVTPEAARRAAPQDLARGDGAGGNFFAVAASRVGAEARGYLADRGLTRRPRLKFRHWWPLAVLTDFALRDHLAGKGVRPRPWSRRVCWWVVRISEAYDRFRDRVMFPIPELPRHRFRRPRIGEDVRSQISELAGNAALPRGRYPSQPRQRPRRRA